MKKFFRTLWSIVWPIAVYLLISLLVEAGYAMYLAFKNYFASGTLDMNSIMDMLYEQSLASTGVASILSIIIFSIIVIKDMQKHPEEKTAAYPNITAAAVMAAIGGCIVGNIILMMSGIMETDEAFNEVNEAILGSSVWIQILVAVILAPVTEELLFRGIVYKRIERGYGFWPAAIVSSLLFGVLHGNLSQFIYATALGLLFAYAYHRSGRLRVCMLMHLIANAAALAMESLAMLLGEPTAFYIITAIAGAGLLIAGLVIMIRKPIETRTEGL